MNTALKLISLCAVALGLAGCGTSGPSLYQAGGTVKYKGTAVEGADVTFVYDDGQSASGLTDAAGKFTLVYAGSGGKKGTALGKGNFVVKKIKAEKVAGVPEGKQKMDPTEMMKLMQKKADENKPKEGAPAPTGPANELPAKYADPKTSGLAREIKTSGNDFALDLE